MTDQTTPRDRLFALIASIPGSASVVWCDDARALVDEIATPPAPLPVSEARMRLLQALDASYCQALGHTPEGLLAAYEASRTQTVDDSTLSVAEVRDRLRGMALTLATGEGPLVEPWAFNQALDDYQAAVAAAVLPATTNHDTDTGAPLSETERKMLDYALDLADEEIATDGSDFTDDEEDALAELRRIVTKPIATGTFELRGDTEIRAAALREAADEAASAARLFPDNEECATAVGALEGLAERLRRVADETAATETTADKAARLGMTPEEYRARRHLAAVRQIRAALPGLYATTGLRVEAALTEPAAGARQAEPVAVPCVECGHPQTDHGEGEDPVTPGRCRTCPDDDAWHDYQAAAGARQDGAQS